MSTYTELDRLLDGIEISVPEEDTRGRQVAAEKVERAKAEVRELREKITKQTRELAELNESRHKKNLQLDALHFVWCDGGCGSGVHRFGDHPPLTKEIVDEAQRNADRLRRWLINHEAKEARRRAP